MNKFEKNNLKRFRNMYLNKEVSLKRTKDFVEKLCNYEANGYKIIENKYLISINNKKPMRITKQGDIVEMATTLHGMKNYGYKTIGINGKRDYLHRVVYETYIGAIPKDLVIDHIDGDRYNNSLDNLQLLTRSKNSLKSCVISSRNKKKVKCLDNGLEFDSIRLAIDWMIANIERIKSKQSAIRAMYLHLNNKPDKKGYYTKKVGGLKWAFKE